MSDHAIQWPTISQQPFAVTIDASFEPLIPKFLTNRRNELQTMTDALKRQDYETVRKVAHGIKGAGGTYGFDALSAVAAGLEQAAKHGDGGAIAAGLDRLTMYLQGVRVEYE
ncbi:MAG: Hpt domain-containing protein [Nitrospiraceae bacterium]